MILKVILKPGESRPLPLGIPPELQLRIAAGGQLELVHGPIIQVGPNRYERLVQLLLDGDPVGDILLPWRQKPSPWYRRWRRRLRGKPEPVAGVRMEVCP